MSKNNQQKDSPALPEDQARDTDDTPWDELPLKPILYPNRQFNSEPVPGEMLTPEEHDALLGTPRGKEPTASLAAPGPCPVVYRMASDNENRLIHPPQQKYAHEFLADVIKALASKNSRGMLTKEFGLSREEANHVIKDLTSKQKPVNVLNFNARTGWLKEYKRIMRAKLIDYIATVMSSRRSRRTRYIAGIVLNHLCDLTGQHCKLNNPQTRVQRIQVYVADRFAAWLANVMAETDKEMYKEYLEKSTTQYDSDAEEDKKKKKAKTEISREMENKNKRGPNEVKSKSPAKKRPEKPSRENKKQKPQAKYRKEDPGRGKRSTKKVDKPKKQKYTNLNQVNPKKYPKEIPKRAEKKVVGPRENRPIQSKKHERIETRKPQGGTKAAPNKEDKSQPLSKKLDGNKIKGGEKAPQSKKGEDIKKRDNIRKKPTVSQKNDSKPKGKQWQNTDKYTGVGKDPEKNRKREEERRKNMTKNEAAGKEKRTEIIKQESPGKRPIIEKGAKQLNTTKNEEAENINPAEKEEAEKIKLAEKEEAEKEKTAEKEEAEKKKPAEKEEAQEIKSAQKEEAEKLIEPEREDAEKIKPAEKGGEKIMAPEIEEAKKLKATGKEETEKIMAADKEETEKIMAADKEEAEKIMAADKEEAEKIMAADKEEAEKMMATDKEEAEKIMAADKEKAEKIMAADKEEAEKIMAADKEEAEKIKTAEKEEDAKIKATGKEEPEIIPATRDDEKDKEKRPGEGAGDVSAEKDRFSAVSRWVDHHQQQPQRNRKRKASISEILINDVKDELPRLLSLEEEAALIRTVEKYAHWIDGVLEEAELTRKPIQKSKVTYHITRHKGNGYFDVEKIQDKRVYDLTKVSRIEKPELISDKVCKRPANLIPLRSSKELKEWATWAADVLDLTEKWAAWIDRTCNEAESIVIAQNLKSGDKSQHDWDNFKKSTKSGALELRRNRKYVRKTADIWNKKIRGE